jgi:hypothetical protein
VIGLENNIMSDLEYDYDLNLNKKSIITVPIDLNIYYYNLIKRTNDGAYLFLDSPYNNNSTKIFLKKLKNGNLVWSKKIFEPLTLIMI